jgi:hypothetical protein
VAVTESVLIGFGACEPPERCTWVSVDGATFLMTMSVAVELPAVTGVKLIWPAIGCPDAVKPPTVPYGYGYADAEAGAVGHVRRVPGHGSDPKLVIRVLAAMPGAAPLPRRPAARIAAPIRALRRDDITRDIRRSTKYLLSDPHQTPPERWSVGECRGWRPTCNIAFDTGPTTRSPATVRGAVFAVVSSSPIAAPRAATTPSPDALAERTDCDPAAGRIIF